MMEPNRLERMDREAQLKRYIAQLCELDSDIAEDIADGRIDWAMANLWGRDNLVQYTIGHPMWKGR